MKKIETTVNAILYIQWLVYIYVVPAPVSRVMLQKVYTSRMPGAETHIYGEVPQYHCDLKKCHSS